MAPTDYQRQIVALAQDGHEGALSILKKEFKPPASPHNPHYFSVHPKLLVISDSHQGGPQTKREVMPAFPRFGKEWISTGKKQIQTNAYGPPSRAVERLKDYPSLTAKISAIAFQEIDEIEEQLVIDDCMPKVKLTKLRTKLDTLTRGSRPVWENWVLSLDENLYYRIDRVVNQWLDEPIDMDESHLFVSGWNDVPYAEMAAKQFFDKISEMLQLYLHVEKHTYELSSNNKPVQLYKLSCSITVVNKRAKALGANFRFEAWV